MTNNRKQIERFNHELDAILHNHNPSQDELDEADRQALDLASKFIELDHSSKSLVRQSLRQSLVFRREFRPKVRKWVSPARVDFRLRRNRAIQSIGWLLGWFS